MIKSKPFSKFMALVLAAVLALGAIPITVSAEAAGCNHTQHDAECGYAEGAECGHKHDESCGENGADCAHTQHDDGCGCIEAAPCRHQHDENCGGLVDSRKTLGESGDTVIVAAFEPLDDEVAWRSYTVNTITEAELDLPDTLTGTDADDNAVTIEGVTWKSYPAFDPAVVKGYVFSAVLPEDYELAAGVTAPQIWVFIQPEGGPEPQTTAVDEMFTVNGIRYKVLTEDTGTDTGTVSVIANSYTGSISIPDKVINGSITYTVTTIAASAFNGRTTLAAISLPEGLTTIGDYAFTGCTSLTSITLPSSLTAINQYAFENCTGLTSVIISGTLDSIGNRAFQNCSALVSVIFSSATPPTTVGDYVFSGASSNLVITVPPGYKADYQAKFIGITISDGTLDVGETFTMGDCEYKVLTKAVTTGTVEVLGYVAGNVLASLVIPDTVTHESIVYTVTEIGESAFSGKSVLKSVVLPDSITSIGERAFNACDNLTYIRFLGDTPPTIAATNSFNIIAMGVNFVVPEGKLSAYNIPAFTSNLPSGYTLREIATPSPGGSGAISTDNVRRTTLTLSWTAATDTTNADMKYYVYQSDSNDINGLTACNSKTPIATLTGATTYNVTGLTANTTYWFNVVVENIDGNKAAYTAVTATTPDKDTVTITGLSAQNGTYNGSGHIGYTGTAVFTDPGNQTVNPTVKTLTAKYNGTSGTTYGPDSTTPPTNAGTYSVTLSLEGDSDYKGTSAAIDFTISKKPLTNEMLTITGTYTYNGSAQSPSYTVTDGVKILVKNTDYTEATLPSETNAGDYTLTISGMGNYTGTASKTFTIIPKPLTNGMLTITGTYTYNGTAQSPSYTVTDGAAVDTADYTAQPLSQINAGNYTFIITGRRNYSGTATQTFTIGKANLAESDLTYSLASVTYDGSPKPVSVSISGKTGYGAITVYYTGTGSTSYARSVTAPTNAGTYDVAVQISGGTNFNATASDVVLTGTYTIDKASVLSIDPSINVKSDLVNDYTLDLKTLLPSSVDPLQVSGYSFVSGDSNAIFSANAEITDDTLTIHMASTTAQTNVATIVIGFTSANYNIGNATITIDVTDKYPITISGVTVASRAYNGQPIAYNASGLIFTNTALGTTVSTLTPVYTWSGGSAPTDAGSYTLTVSADGGTEYDVADLVISFEITKANQTINFPMPGVNRVGRTETLTAAATSGLAVTYASNDTALATVTGGTLTLLTEGTVTITASQAGDSNHNAAADVTHTITILPAASSDATLSGLTISAGTLTPAFNAATTSYTASVANSVNSVTITAVKNHSAATVTGDIGAKSLSVGANTFTITVTAEDGTTAEIYTVTITRASASTNNDRDSDSGSSGSSSGGGSTTTTTTTKTVPAAEGAVKVSYTQSGGVVTLSMTDSKIQEIINKSADTAVLDMSGVQDATAATLPKAALTAFAGAELGVEIRLPQGTVTLSNEAAASIGSQAAGNISFAIGTVDSNTLSEAQQNAAGGRPVYELTVTSGSKTITNLGGPVEVALPYAPQPGENPNAIVVYYLSADGKLQMVENGVYDSATKTVTFVTDHFSRYMIGYNLVTFNDVASSHWGKAAIDFAAARGLVSGMGDGRYDPERPITRAEFVQMMQNVLKLPAGTGSSEFADVSAGSWYYSSIMAAKKAGLFNGLALEGNNFLPNQSITREEMAVILANIALYKNMNGGGNVDLTKFGDYNAIKESYLEKLQIAIANGFLSPNGVGGNLFDPEGVTTRAQAAQVQKNLLDALR